MGYPSTTLVVSAVKLVALAAAGKLLPGVVYSVSGQPVVALTAATWRPLSGRFLIGSTSGSVAAPVQGKSGSTAYTFSPKYLITAGLLTPGCMLTLRARLRKTGSGGTAVLQAYLGSTGTAADAVVWQVPVGAAGGGHEVVADTRMYVYSTAVVTCEGTAVPNTDQVPVAFDATTNIDTTGAMTFTLGVAAANAGDSFSLGSFSLWMETP